MKVSKEVLDKVEEMLNNFIKDQLNERYISNQELCNIQFYFFDNTISQREMRAAIQELRCTGQVRCLIASGRGYKFTNVTSEMENYLKRIHKSAMQILRLYSAEKQQAETDLQMQLTLPFYTELYQEKKNIADLSK